MKVPSKIVPSGAFPVVDDLNVKGGIKVIANQAVMANLPLHNLKDGALALTADTGEVWKFQSSTSTWFKYKVHLNNLPLIPLNKIVGGIAKDAFRSVATLVDLAELPTSALDTGVVCLVQDSGALYEYNGTTSTWALMTLSIGNIPVIPGDQVGAGLHAIAFSGDYNALINIPANASVEAEVTARTAAVAAEAVARAAGDTVVQGNVTAEAVARSAADLVIQGNLDSEVSARVAADSTLTTNLAAEATARAAAIAAEVIARDAAIAAVVGGVTPEALALKAAITYVDTQDAAEATARTTALALKYDAANPSGFQTLAQVNSAITAVVGAAPEALNTLQEIAAQLATDESAVSALTTTVAGKAATTYVDSQDAAEVTNRTAADTTLQANITAEATARTSADTTLQANIDAEASARTSADSTNAASIVSEAAARTAALALKYDASNPSAFQTLAQVNSAIAAVVGAAPAALDTLKEISDQLAVDESAVSALTTTVASRATTAYVDTQDAAEATARAAADTTLQANIDAEATARTSALALKYDASNPSGFQTLAQVNSSSATALGSATSYTDTQIAAEATARAAVNTRINASHFVYDGSTPAQVHSITHNLGFLFCLVAVYDSLNVLRTDTATVTLINPNQLEVDLGVVGVCTVVIAAPKA